MPRHNVTPRGDIQLRRRNLELKELTMTKRTAFDVLLDYAQLCAECPCCGEVMECPTDCTFAQDAPQAWGRMELAREALREAAEART